MDEGARRLGGPSRDVHHRVFHGLDPRRRLGRIGPQHNVTLDARLARKHDAAIVGSVGVRDAQGEASNRMWMATPEGELHVYDKRHLFTLAGEHNAPSWCQRVEVTGAAGTSCSKCVTICASPPLSETTAAPLTTWRSMWRTGPSHAEAWRTLLQARAIENQCFVVGVNRSGTDANGHRYAGDSMIVDHAGHLLADAGREGQPAILRA